MIASATAGKWFLKALPYILGVILLLGSAYVIYGHIYDKGVASVQVEWDKAKQAHRDAIQKLKDEYALLEEDHRTENQRITDELAKANLDHATALAAVERQYAERLRTSEVRAGVYQRQAQGGAAERASLADHASRLDASLEEGRSLVRELRETLGLRDRQIRSLSEQIRNDRKLFTEETGQ